MKIYITGPMSGLPQFNFPAFFEMSERLTKLGVEHVNPAALTAKALEEKLQPNCPDEKYHWDFAVSLEADVARLGIPYEEWLRRDVQAMTTCDSILLMDGWEKSKGANLEVNLARNLGFKVYKMVNDGLTEVDISKIGVKFDGGKLQWSLLPNKEVAEVVKVLMFGAVKYQANNWQKVAGSKDRYYDAAKRHLDAWFHDGHLTDGETGLHPLAHAICCMLFAMWHDWNPK